MSSTKSNTPKWILVATGVVGLVAAALVVVVRYYEIQKARAEAAQAQWTHEQARKKATTMPQTDPAPKTGSPITTKTPVPVAKPKSNREPASPAPLKPAKPSETFQTRSSTTTVLTVGHGKVEVTAQAVAERRVIITIVGRDFGNDLSPLQEWIGKTGDLFQRKIKELGLGFGTWVLVSDARTFTVRDGVASLALTWELR